MKKNKPNNESLYSYYMVRLYLKSILLRQFSVYLMKENLFYYSIFFVNSYFIDIKLIIEFTHISYIYIHTHTHIYIK